MRCAECGHENPGQAKFCIEWAAPLAQRSTNCGTHFPPGAKFCPECAHPIGSRPAAEPRFVSPQAYTPRHLAEEILTSKGALEGVWEGVEADVANALEVEEQGPDFTLPATTGLDRLPSGQGVVPFRETFRCLVKKGYRGYLTYEAPNPAA